MPTTATRLFVLLIAACSCREGLADHIVLQSVSEAYSAGELLGDSITIELAEGETLVLLSEAGDVVDIAGPYSGKPSGSDVDDFDLTTALRSLIDNADNVHASLGSTRSGLVRVNPSDERPAWVLDPLRSGAQCVQEGGEIVFWREDTGQELTLIIQRPGLDGSGQIVWKAGQATASWPNSVSIVHGELYVIRRQGWMESALVYLALIPQAVTASAAATTAWLAANGCREQAEIKMQSMVSSDTTDIVEKQ